jgi:GMP synthase (glutamine-hydrolysing)
MQRHMLHNETASGDQPIGHQPAPSDKPVLLVLHQQTSSAGAVGHWLTRNSYRIDIRHPMLGDPLPDDLSGHAAVIVFGGPMSANDNTLDVRREIDWLERPLLDDVPYLGICLGAQMMVRHLGGQISTHKNELVEIGYHDLAPTAEGAALFDWPSKFFQWHGEGFEIPHGGTKLASGERFENQAYRYGRAAFGVQFHPEITELIVRRWTIRGNHMLKRKGAHTGERLLADHLQYNASQRLWLQNFMTYWTSLIRT